MMAEEKYFVNNYIPYYPINKDDLDDTLLRNEYEKINKDKKNYLKKTKIVNFDIIHHECRRDPLQNNVKYYETIHKQNLQRAKEEDKEDFISEAVKSNREDLYIKNDIIHEHFKLSQELIDFKLKNKTLFSSMHGRKNKKI